MCVNVPLTPRYRHERAHCCVQKRSGRAVACGYLVAAAPLVAWNQRQQGNPASEPRKVNKNAVSAARPSLLAQVRHTLSYLEDSLLAGVEVQIPRRPSNSEQTQEPRELGQLREMCANGTMPSARGLLALCLLVALVLAPRDALAWIENHVLGDEVTITVDAAGKAVVEHRILLHTNGSVRFREYSIAGVDRDAVPLPNSYVVTSREALSNTLETATPLTLKLTVPPDKDGEAVAARLDIAVDDDKGLRRGTYVLVIRYRTDLVATGAVKADGAFTRITWTGPIIEDGFDNARTTFVVPRAATKPRGVAEDPNDENDEPEAGDAAPTFLTESRRGQDTDEIELLRTYASKGEAVVWAVRIDPRALTTAAVAEDQSKKPTSDAPLVSTEPVPFQGQRRWWALGLAVVAALLVWLKWREVNALARDAGAEMPGLFPFTGWLRAPLAGVALAAGVTLQLGLARPHVGAWLVLLATLLTVYRPARVDAQASMRGPGRWLTVTENEALRGLPRPRGGWLDASTWRGKTLLVVLLAGLGVAVWKLLPISRWHAALLAADGVFLLALFGTGMGRALPPDMTVEPARFLARVVRRLRKRKDLDGIRIVPRIRIPTGEVDADEVRLLLAPRSPLRGFTAIEIGLTYAVGMGARVGMPEVLLRVVADSPCEQAVAAISRIGRTAPGRKRDERVISLAPRFPTVRMTAEIAAAVAIRVVDREARAVRKARAKAPAKKAA